MCHVRLDRAVLDALQLEGLLQDLLGLRERCVDVGGAAFDVRREVVQGTGMPIESGSSWITGAPSSIASAGSNTAGRTS